MSAASLLETVAYLADPHLAGRFAGSPGEAAAFAHLAAELTRLGLTPVSQSFAIGARSSSNLYAILPGLDPGEVIVFGAHVDHLGVQRGELYPGAEDNASGVAAALGVARALARARGRLGRSVIIVFFGAEEIGLLGSRAFVRAPPIPLAQVRAMINLDMVGRPFIDEAPFGPLKRALGIDDRRAVGLLGVRRHKALRAVVDAAAEREGVAIVAPEDFPAAIEGPIVRASAGRSDSQPFEDAGIPSLFFGSGESSDYHAPTDRVTHLAPDVLERRARMLANVVSGLSLAPAEAFSESHDVGAPRRRPAPGYYLPVGLGVGLAVHPRAPSAAYVAGELSLVALGSSSLLWAGAYADGVYDAATSAVRLSVGPELGLGPVGVDAGGLLEVAAGRTRGGVCVRPILTASVLSVVGRFGILAGTGAIEGFGEAGVLLKWPVRLR